MTWIEEVIAARKSGSFEKTMELLNTQLLLTPSDPLVHYQIAWTHDALGKEKDAVPSYEQAIKLGLSGEDLKGAYLGLGSTYRCLGEYEKSRDNFLKAEKQFPDFRAYKVFRSLTEFNLGRPEKAVEILLNELVETTSDESIRAYSKALLFYSDKLTEKFE